MESNEAKAAARALIAALLADGGPDRVGIRWLRLDATAGGSRGPRLECLLRCLPGTLTGMQVVFDAHGFSPPAYPTAKAALSWLVAAGIAEVHQVKR